MTINFDKALGIHPQALALREKRGELLAANLANADTPGYKARDLNFETVFKQNLELTQTMERTHVNNLPTRNVLEAQTLYRNPNQASLDGNTVEANVEQAKYAENAVQYQASLQFLNGKFFRADDGPAGAIIMSSLKIFDIAGSGMNAQSLRLNLVASNISNANSVSSSTGSVYKARQPVFSADLEGAMNKMDSASKVKVLGVVESQAPTIMEYAPNHPMADKAGYIYKSNVNTVEEMANMMSASRSYQNNVEVLNTAKQLILQTLKMGA